MNLYKQATIYDIGRYDDMFSKVRINTYKEQQLILFGVMPGLVDTKEKANIFFKDSSPINLYESIETLKATYGVQSSSNTSPIQYNPDTDKIFCCEVITNSILDTMDTYSLSRMEKIYRSKKADIEKNCTNIIDIDDKVIEHLKNSNEISGIRKFVTEGKPIYPKSKFKSISYVVYTIYNKKILKNIIWV